MKLIFDGMFARIKNSEYFSDWFSYPNSC